MTECYFWVNYAFNTSLLRCKDSVCLSTGKKFVGDLLNDGKIRWVETGQILTLQALGQHTASVWWPGQEVWLWLGLGALPGTETLVQFKTTWLHKYQPSADMVSNGGKMTSGPCTLTLNFYLFNFFLFINLSYQNACYGCENAENRTWSKKCFNDGWKFRRQCVNVSDITWNLIF